MLQSLNVSIIKNSEHGAALLARELHRGGFELSNERVDSEFTMTEAIERRTRDIVLADYSMPLFYVKAALDLLAANRELKAFSYSVSHDLRAPLRGIDRFSQVLQEDYAKLLDEDGRNCTARIRQSAHRMGGLIDDLLKLSRITAQ